VGVVGSATEVGRGPAPPPRRVVVLTESTGLATLLGHLLADDGRLASFGSLREALEHDALLDADAVVLDLPREGADTAVAHVRHHWKGALVVLAERGHHRRDLAPEPAWTQLTRPFSAQQLAAALGLPIVAEPGPRPEPAHPATAAGSGPAAGPAPGRPALGGVAGLRAAVGRAESWARAAGNRVAATELGDWALGTLAGFAEAWQSRRRVRVAGISLFALLAFSVAFALASRDRCGPSCDAFGTGFSPLPTVAPAGPAGPVTTDPRRPPATSAPRRTPGTGEFAGATGDRRATTTTTERLATTTSRGSGGAPGPTTPPTRPPTTPTEPPTTPTTQGTPTTTTIGLPGLPLP
jgi:hypothetical protein